MLARKDKVVAQNNDGILFLFKKNKVAFFHGRGSFAGGSADAGWSIKVDGAKPAELVAKHVIVATGSKPRALPGVAFDNVRVLDNDGALAMAEVPKRLGVVGAGVIGLEMGSVWRRLGAQTTVLEALPDVPRRGGRGGREGSEAGLREAGARDPHRRRDHRASTRRSDEVVVDYNDAAGKRAAGGVRPADRVDRPRAAHGRPRRRQRSGLGLDERGFVAVDGECRTNLANVWAIGDVVRGPMLAHKAEEEGVAVAERIAGQHGHVDFNTVPWVIYTSPEIAWVGKTEQQLKADGVAYRAGSFPFAANGRARALGDTTGFVKILADAATDRILGMHVIGPFASELIAEGVVAMEFGAASEDLARICHAHPSLSEATKEAALAVDGRTLNL